MADLIVDDQYIKDLGNYYKCYAETIQNAIDEYLNIMNSAKTDAVKFGATADALDSFLEYAKELHDIVSYFGLQVESVCNRFIEEVDEKDQYLY